MRGCVNRPCQLPPAEPPGPGYGSTPLERKSPTTHWPRIRVAREDVPLKIARGSPVEIPAVLLARLALSEALRRQQLGAVLVADALQRIIDAAETVAARLVVVDALHERVAQFLRKCRIRSHP